MTDIATRVYDHAWRIDPIVRSLLDTDFYKLLMLQTVFRRHPDVEVEFSLINRSRGVPLARLVDEDELRAQLSRYAEAVEEDLTAGREKVAARTREGLALEQQFVDASNQLINHLKGKPEVRELMNEITAESGINPASSDPKIIEASRAAS